MVKPRKLQANVDVELLKRIIIDGDVDALLSLINDGVDVEGVEFSASVGHQKLTTVLEAAVYQNHREIIAILLASGAELYPGEGQFYYIFKLLKDRRHLGEVVRLLRNYQQTDEENLTTALQVACRKGNLQIVQLLLEQGADPHQFDCLGANVLHCAAKGCNPEIVKLFIDKFGIEATDVDGDTALHYVLWSPRLNNNKVQVVQQLLDRGIDVRRFNHDAQSAYVLQDFFLCGCEPLEMLLQHTGTDLSVITRETIDYLDSSRETMTVVSRYVAKMISANHQVPQVLLNKINSDYFLRDYVTKCNQELELMKKSTNLHHMLLLDDVNQLAALTRNIEVAAELTMCQREEDSKFPIYICSLKYQLLRGLWRNLLLDKVKWFFHALALTEENKGSGLPELPLICVEMIFSFFESNDFRALINVCDPFNEFNMDICNVTV